MKTPDPTALLSAWERGAAGTPAQRALLLLAAAQPQAAPEALARLSIGHRDACLLALRESLFGGHVDGLSHCPRCGEAIQIDFDIGDIRMPHGEGGVPFDVEDDGRVLRVRLPDSNDLLDLDGARDPAAARRQLLSCCLLDGLPDALPDAALQAIDERLAALDAQAEVLLEIGCPGCGHVAHAPFEIEAYMWAELDTWARERLRQVHLIAHAYGWPEAAILSMSDARRRAYLALLGA